MRVKRIVEGIISVMSMVVVGYVVWLYGELILMGRDPPTQLAVLAVAGILGAIGAAMKAKDVEEALSILGKLRK
jgi:hypothetical protein